MSDEQQNAPERDILREHSYDGIQEYDNQLPRWWLALFGLSTVWAIFYIAYFHFGLFGGGLVGPERLQAQLQAIEADLAKNDTGPLSEEELRKIWNDPARIADGEKLFISTACNSCHQDSGLGNVGPNLRDDYWLHGNNISDIINTITNGSPNKQMQPQNTRLNRRQIQSVAFYLIDHNRNSEKNEDGTTKLPGKKPDLERAKRANFDYLDAPAETSSQAATEASGTDQDGQP